MMRSIAVTLGVLGLCSSAAAASPDDINVRSTSIATVTSADSMGSWQPCESCEWAVRSLQDFVADPQHQAQLAEALDSMACTFVPADLKKECDRKVAAAVKHAVQMFEDYISPASVCKPLCVTDGMHSQPFHLPHGRYRYPTCSQCQFVAAEIAESDNSTLDGDAICGKLPESFIGACSCFVNMHGTAMQESIAANGKESACMASGLCELEEMTTALSTVPVPEDIKVAAASFASTLGAAQAKSVLLDSKETCEFCRLAVMEVRDKISDPVFQHELETYAKGVCQNIGDYKTMCVQYVDEYGPIAFALAEDYLDPRMVCGVLHMCPTPGEY